MQIQRINPVKFQGVKVSGVSPQLLDEVCKLNEIKGFANCSEKQALKKLEGNKIALILSKDFTFVCKNKETEQEIANLAKQAGLYKR